MTPARARIFFLWTHKRRLSPIPVADSFSSLPTEVPSTHGRGKPAPGKDRLEGMALSRDL